MLQIALAIYGLIVLFTGKIKLSADKVVVGTPARLLALIMLAPLPLAFLAGLGIGVWAGATGKVIDDIQVPLMLVEAGITIGAAIVAFSIAHVIGKSPEEAALPAWASQYPTAPPPPSDPDNPYQSPHV
jgi:hypothetical protein